MPVDFSPTRAFLRRRLARRFAFLATSAASCLLPAWAGPNPGLNQDDALQKFADQGHNYCDARVLAAFWGEESAFEAKLRLGATLLRGDYDRAQADLEAARTRALERSRKDDWVCSWDTDGGYGYEDVELLAQYWGLSEPYQAKLAVQRLLIRGNESKILTSLEEARREQQADGDDEHEGAGGYVPVHPADEAAEKFFQEGYSYCDAKVLAAFWGEPSPWDAKVRLGDKMLSGGPQVASEDLVSARLDGLSNGDENLPCWYDDEGYDYRDAEVLAGYWHLEEVWEGKIRMSRMLVEGRVSELQAELDAAHLEAGSTVPDGR